MSTTFEVFPSVDVIPTFAELLRSATGHVNDYLRSYKFPHPVSLRVSMRRTHNDTNADVPFALHDPVWWPEPDQYAWFHVPGTPGGTDAYSNALNDSNISFLEEALDHAKNDATRKRLESSRLIKRMWYFRRSAGQPAIINIAYGVLAASLAQLTEGVIFTSDSAWNHRLFPALPADFLTWYFRPELATDARDKEWSEKCLQNLPDELRKAIR